MNFCIIQLSLERVSQKWAPVTPTQSKPILGSFGMKTRLNKKVRVGPFQFKVNAL